jgi:hypothetical protein
LTSLQGQISAPPPVLLYSDIDSGPATGGEGQTDGAFVCVFGENFGRVQGSSKISIGGVPLATYKLWTDRGSPYQPGRYAKACGQVSHLTASGAQTVTLTTNAGTASLASVFRVRPGKIYFVAAVGHDQLGRGSSDHPWLTIKRCKNAMNPGDICYVRAGVFSAIENYGAALVLDSSGAPGSPKAIVAYPGETVSIDNRKSGSGRAAVRSYLTKGTYAGGQSISDWTLAGLSINGSGQGMQFLPGNNIRLVDNEILCEGERCSGADGGLLVGHPVAVSSHVTVLGNRIHNVGCHEDADYKSSVAPCAWNNAGHVTITTSGSSWTTTATVSGFLSGGVIEVNGQLRRVTCDTAYCRAGRLDAPFTSDLKSEAFQFRLPAPTKLFHTVYFGNVNAVQFGWNDVDGSEGQACRGILFHSTNGHNEYDLHVFSNAIHDTVCDCLNFATVDPNRGTVEAYNNTLYNCGTANQWITGSSYSAIYSSNNNDDYAETMTRKGNIEVYHNTIYNAGSGGLYGKACIAVNVAGASTAVFPHAELSVAVEAGKNVRVQVNALCGYGVACAGTQRPVPFRAGQLAMMDTGSTREEVEIASVPDETHVVFSSVARAHAAGTKLIAENGNVGIVASNNICVQPGMKGTTYFSTVGSDQAGRTSATYLSGNYNDCYGLAGSCPPQLNNSFSVSPAFTSAVLHDFRPQSATLLSADRATSKTPPTDQDGTPRSQRPTVGAFETVPPSRH